MFDLNINIDVKVDKKLLLDRNPEERYFSFYLGINPVRGHYYKNPLRPDSGAGCKFYRNSSKELVFRDFARNVDYSFIDVVIEKFGCTYGEALDIIANDFILSEHFYSPVYNKAINFIKKQDFKTRIVNR